MTEMPSVGVIVGLICLSPFIIIIVVVLFVALLSLLNPKK